MPRRLRREAAGLSRLLEDVSDFDAIGVFFSVQTATSLIEPRPNAITVFHYFRFALGP